LPRRPRKREIVDTHLRRGFKNDGNIDVLDSSDEEFTRDIPYFDIRDTKSGVGAPIPKHVEKTLTADGITYRLPARGILLDFIENVHKTINDPLAETNNAEILLALDELALRPNNEREAVRDLCFLQAANSKDMDVFVAKKNLNTLLDVVIASPRSLPNGNRGKTQSSVPAHSPEQEDFKQNILLDDLGDLSLSEREQLLAIKKLISVKGRDKVMEFLLND
jgi:hypothetical protein